MTFDEAIEELRLAIPERFYSPTMHDIAVMLEAQTKVINLLREEYAPTVEMTKTEQVKLLDYLEMSNLQEFMDVVTYEDDLYETLSFEDIAQAWLHPETIKVVDE